MEISIEYLNKITQDTNHQIHNILNLKSMGFKLTASAEDIEKLNDSLDALKIAISMISPV